MNHRSLVYTIDVAEPALIIILPLEEEYQAIPSTLCATELAPAPPVIHRPFAYLISLMRCVIRVVKFPTDVQEIPSSLFTQNVEELLYPTAIQYEPFQAAAVAEPSPIMSWAEEEAVQVTPFVLYNNDVPSAKTIEVFEANPL
jgi:hypothetical protein